MRGQLVSHVLAYAEMLLAWQLLDKRAELLKLIEDDIRLLRLDTVVAEATLFTALVGTSILRRISLLLVSLISVQVTIVSASIAGVRAISKQRSARSVTTGYLRVVLYAVLRSKVRLISPCPCRGRY